MRTVGNITMIYIYLIKGSPVMSIQELAHLFNRYRDILNVPIASRLDDNFDLYKQIYNMFTKDVNTSIKDIKVNLSFISPYGEIRDFRSNSFLDLTFQTQYINVTDFDDFIFGKKTLAELIKDYCEKFDCSICFSDRIFNSSYSSWDNYLLYIDYNDINLELIRK
jgi:hypothetical protein